MTDDKVVIKYGKQLNDRHINHAQVIIKHQFGMKGLQLTLYQHTRKLVENKLQIIHSRNKFTGYQQALLCPHLATLTFIDDVDADNTKVIHELFGKSQRPNTD